MKSKLCSINLSVKDYTTKDKGTFSYKGEVIEQDTNLKKYIYRFYETDSGTMQVTIDFSQDKILIIEQTDSIISKICLQPNCYQTCLQQFENSYRLELATLAWKIDIREDKVYLDYDIYDVNDTNHEHPITRNIVEIITEEVKPC